MPPIMNEYAHPHTKAWAAKIATFDGFVFVTPEYNHSTSGALKNAIDYLYREWNDKAAGFVGYGGVGGTRAVEHLRLIMGEIKSRRCAGPGRPLAPHRLRELHHVQSRSRVQEAAVNAMLDDLVAWGEALRAMRLRRSEGAA